MASEGRAISPEGSPDTPRAPAEGSTVTLGLVAAPDIPEKIATELASELPGLLAKQVDGSVSWEVAVLVDPLTGTDMEAPEILDECRQRMLEEGWDLAVCLTDLPVYRGGTLVAADASAKRGVAGISLPALGALRVHSKARKLTLQLAGELYEGTKERGADDPPTRRSRATEPVGSFRKIDPPDEDMKAMDVDVRFASPGVLGHLGLWSGMVLANRPWKILPAFKTAIAAAFGMAAWVLASSAIWMLADSLGLARLLFLMVLSMTAIAAWIIVAHGLWEHPNEEETPHWAALYNGVTVLTMTTAMLLAYLTLFVLVLVAAIVFVPGDYLRSTLGHPVSLGDYATIVWLATSLATIVGALGSTLEDEETVRNAVYGYRQRRRQEEEDANDSQEEPSAA